MRVIEHNHFPPKPASDGLPTPLFPPYGDRDPSRSHPLASRRRHHHPFPICASTRTPTSGVGAGYGCPFLNSQVPAFLMPVFRASLRQPTTPILLHSSTPFRLPTLQYSGTPIPTPLHHSLTPPLHSANFQRTARLPHPGSDQIAWYVLLIPTPTAQILAQFFPLSNRHRNPVATNVSFVANIRLPKTPTGLQSFSPRVAPYRSYERKFVANKVSALSTPNSQPSTD